MNELPRVGSASDGLFRRVKVLHFEGIPEEKRDPAVKSSIEGEGAGILNFERAENWEGLLAEHERWLESYNTQRHWANEGREDGRRSPSEVLGSLTVVRHHPEDLSRAFFSSRFIRTLDALGYARFRRWRVYAEEGLARLPVALWLGEDDLTVHYGADTLSSYDVSFSPGETKLRAVTNPRLFATSHQRNWPQLKLFGLEEALGEGGWLKALELEEYAARSRNKPETLQGALFSYLEAL